MGMFVGKFPGREKFSWGGVIFHGEMSGDLQGGCPDRHARIQVSTCIAVLL